MYLYVKIQCKQEVVKCCLWFYTTRTHRICHIMNVKSKFMFI